ncbi:MAG: RluA family pseudouridine synthase [Bacteroidales bacterium]|jgi:23S rRNA pseudouridine1911/1915/1917 synthase|nr:RluA family pseudouridine synthase [Bacteroidales bacterium]MBP5213165.1 RluA family pseudouridine synthase [Bacteroidales bacterium]
MAGEVNQEDTSGLFEHFRFVADRGQRPIRVDKFLVDRIVGTSRNRIQRAADGGFILVNGKPEKVSFKVKPNDVVQVMMDRPRHSTEIVPEDIPLDIVYEDEDLLVVNKPAGMVVHPGHGNYTGTLVNALAFHLGYVPEESDDEPDTGDEEEENFDFQKRMGLVHRIDKETSGLLVIAKNEDAGTSLSRQFFHKTTRRLYTALVWGHLDADEGVIEGNIGRNHRDRTLMEFYPPGSEEGKPAVTHYKVLQRLGYVTLVQCRLETGRTHQIRVHMKHIGHTLFNDKTYGGDRILKGTTFSRYTQFVNKCFEVCPRQALHAQTLGFRHPRTGEEMDFEAPLPSDMQQLVSMWNEYIAQRET